MTRRLPAGSILPGHHFERAPGETRTPHEKCVPPARADAGMAYAGLLLYFFVYFGRPEDWIPGLAHVPVAKITGLLVLFALAFSVRSLRLSLPREFILLLLLVGDLLLASVLSPVWRGGAVQVTLDFAKVLIVAFALGVAVNTARQLRLLIFIQASAVAIIAAVGVLTGRMLIGRLGGTLSGNYGDPNDLALAIVITLPLCLALLFLSKSRIWKATLVLAMLVMTYAVLMTGSRGGFLALVVVAAVCLWDFAIKGRRFYVFVPVLLACATLWVFSSATLVGRLRGTFDQNNDTAAAYGSAQERQQLFWRSIVVTAENPLFGIGPGSFLVVSGNWHVTHNSFTQMSSEGGIPAFLLYVLILWCGFSNVRAAKQLARADDPTMLLACALRASLAGYVVGSSFVSVAYQFFPYILVAESTVLLYIAKTSIPVLDEKEPVRQAIPSRLSYLEPTAPNAGWYRRHL